MAKARGLGCEGEGDVGEAHGKACHRGWQLWEEAAWATILTICLNIKSTVSQIFVGGHDSNVKCSLHMGKSSMSRSLLGRDVAKLLLSVHIQAFCRASSATAARDLFFGGQNVSLSRGRSPLNKQTHVNSCVPNFYNALSCIYTRGKVGNI